MTDASRLPLIYRSHKAIAPFRLHRPTSVPDAVAASVAAGPGAAFLAGGVDLVPALRAGRAPGDVIHLGGVAELDRIERRGDDLVIGGGVTYRRIETDPVLADALPDLAQAWRLVANIRVRIVGTLGGNIMSDNPTYDALPALAALGARLDFAGPGGAQTVDLSRTPLSVLPSGLLLVSATIPLSPTPRLHVERAYKPVAALFLARRDDRLRAAVSCAHGRVVAASGPVGDAPETLASAFPPTVTDAWASAAYRARLLGVLIGRGVSALKDG